MPNKTIYVSDEDAPIFQRAAELAGSLSAAILTALRRWIDIEEGRLEGFEEVVVGVGAGGMRKQRFSGVFLGEWVKSTNSGIDTYRIYFTRTGKYAVHRTKSAEWKSGDDKYNAGWRSWVGNWSSNQTWGSTPESSTLEVAANLDELMALLPEALRELVAAAVDQPTIEDLDI